MGRQRNRQSYQPSKQEKKETITGLQPRPFRSAIAQRTTETTDHESAMVEPKSSAQAGFNFGQLQLFSEGDASVDRQAFPIQTKLTLGSPNDKYEQEADQVAADVVQRINALQEQQPDPIQQASAVSSLQQMKEPEEEGIRRTSLIQCRSDQTDAVSNNLETAIHSARGRGQSLSPDIQTRMGQAMGADFSGVRVHTDAQADNLNRSIQAKAFTTGRDVFFRQGEYQPGSRAGQELIAHELTHTIQQGQSPTVQAKLHNGSTVVQRDVTTGFQEDTPDDIVGDVDLSGFTDQSTKTHLGGKQELLDDPETTTTTKVGDGTVTTTETSKKGFSGVAAAAQKISESDDTSVKEAFQALARAGAFGEAAAKKVKETSSGTKMEVEGKSSGFVGGESEVVSTKVVDVIDGLTIMARATTKAGLGFDLEGLAQISKEVGGMELSAQLKSKLSGFAGVMAEAKGKLNITAFGIAASGSAKVMAGVKSEGEVTVNIKAGELGGEAQGKFEALAGVEAGVEGQISVSLLGISASGKAEAFAGSKVKTSGSAAVKYQGRILFKISGEVEASAGVGASIEGTFSFENGKLVIGGKLAGALGLGGGGGVTLTVDFKEIGLVIKEKLKNALTRKALDNTSISDQDRKSTDDLTPEQEENMKSELFEAAHPHLLAYAKKKETRKSKGKAKNLVKRENIQEILDKKVRKNSKVSKYLEYKFSDGILEQACRAAFGDQLVDPDGIIIQAGVIRSFPLTVGSTPKDGFKKLF
ncbi:DUF4157 domain-containing protein [Leptothoe sp. ISB3NOV94-8A]